MNKNKDSLILAADTQLTYDYGLKMMTHKILIHQKNKIILAFSGDVAYKKVYESQYTYLESVLYHALQQYPKMPYKAFLIWLRQTIYHFLRCMPTVENKYIQVMVVTYDEKICFDSIFVSMWIPKETLAYQPLLHQDSYAIGHGSYAYNQEHLHANYQEYNEKALFEQVHSVLSAKIHDIKLPTIGGRAEWVWIHPDLTLETNIL